MRRLKVVLAAGMLLFAATACGNDDNPSDGASGTDTKATATAVDVTAKDFQFVVPATIKGESVAMSFKNEGQAPHFAAFAKVADGKTFADAKAFLTAAPGAAPAGPPPFTEWAGSPTTNPGGSSKLNFNLPVGTYALFCAIPAPDGVSHAAKGMVAEVTVTAGDAVDLPEAAGTITAQDFSLTAPPTLKAGENVVKLQNNGKQLHEINLIELGAGKTMTDVIAWTKSSTGPPPNQFLSGVAVAPNQAGTATINLTKGSTYAFVCLIPDSVSGDFVPHLLKGMATATFTV